MRGDFLFAWVMLGFGFIKVLSGHDFHLHTVFAAVAVTSLQCLCRTEMLFRTFQVCNSQGHKALFCIR